MATNVLAGGQPADTFEVWDFKTPALQKSRLCAGELVRIQPAHGGRLAKSHGEFNDLANMAVVKLFHRPRPGETDHRVEVHAWRPPGMPGARCR